MSALTGEEVDRFAEEGFLHLRRVVPPDIVAAGRRVIWNDLGQDPDDPSSWTEPVARLLPSDPRPFKAAFDNLRLFEAFDRQGWGAGSLDRISASSSFGSRILPTRETPVGTSTAAFPLAPGRPRTSTSAGGE